MKKKEQLPVNTPIMQIVFLNIMGVIVLLIWLEYMLDYRTFEILKIQALYEPAGFVGAIFFGTVALLIGGAIGNVLLREKMVLGFDGQAIGMFIVGTIFAGSIGFLAGVAIICKLLVKGWHWLTFKQKID
ncbi:MAG: hypothetical protein WC408_01070 [Candidatus Micrarchaeia archaeon]|jgi:hypothetical protein